MSFIQEDIDLFNYINDESNKDNFITIGQVKYLLKNLNHHSSPSSSPSLLSLPSLSLSSSPSITLSSRPQIPLLTDVE